MQEFSFSQAALDTAGKSRPGERSTLDTQEESRPGEKRDQLKTGIIDEDPEQEGKSPLTDGQKTELKQVLRDY
jgi:hypothetical protein